MQLRIGSVLAVPVERDEVLVGPVEALRIGKTYMSVVSVGPKALAVVQARVGGRWYELWECGVLNASLELVSLAEYLDALYSRQRISQ